MVCFSALRTTWANFDGRASKAPESIGMSFVVLAYFMNVQRLNGVRGGPTGTHIAACLRETGMCLPGHIEAFVLLAGSL